MSIVRDSPSPLSGAVRLVRRLTIGLVAVVAALLAPSLPAAPQAAGIELRPAGPDWEVRYRLAAPARELVFVRNPEPGREQEDWRPQDPAFELVREDGRDRVRRRDGRPFAAVALVLPPRFVPYEADYAPFARYGDGGLLLHSGRFHACAEGCPRTAQGDEGPWRIAIRAPRGMAVLQGGKRHRGATRWLDAGDGAMVYVGHARPLEHSHFLALLDPQLPADIGALLRTQLPSLMDHFAARLGDAHGAGKPMLFASRDPAAREDGRFGTKGGTLPGQVFMHLYGAGWDDPARSAQLRGWLPWFFAHEAAHLFQRHELARDPAHAWIHEGGAEAFAWLALHRLAPEQRTELETRLDDAVAGCAGALATRALHEAREGAGFEAHYQCGMLVQLALDAAVRRHSGGRHDLFDVWRDYHTRLARGAPWSDATFLAAAAAYADPPTVRTLTRFVSERPADPRAAAAQLRDLARHAEPGR